jgi:hypothetical protein
MRSSLLMQLGTVILLLVLGSQADAASDPSGAFLGIETGYSDGSATYQNANSPLSGFLGKLELGYRFGNFLSLGAVGFYETPTLKNAGGAVGQFDTLGYGADVRIYFLWPLYLSVTAGSAQSKFTPTGGANPINVPGVFYLIEPGIELELNPQLTLSLGLGSRVLTYIGTEFQNVRSQYYSLTLNIFL